MKRTVLTLALGIMTGAMFATSAVVSGGDQDQTQDKGHGHDHGHDHAHGHGHGHEQGKGHGEHAGNPHGEMDMEKVMAEWMKIAAPGENHKHLNYFVGKWKTKTTMYMEGPDKPPTVTDGTSEVKWVLDGRFIQDTHHGSMMGMPYKGIGMTGYDNYRNMYVSSWLSNMGTNYLTMTGMRNPESGNYTFYGEMDEPALKVVGRTVKYVTTIKDENHYKFEIIDLHAGDDYEVIQIDYARVK